MKRTFKHLRNKAYTYTAILTLLAATLNPGMTAYADEPGEAAGTESSNSSESSSSSSEGSSSSESNSSSSEGGNSNQSGSSSEDEDEEEAFRFDNFTVMSNPEYFPAGKKSSLPCYVLKMSGQENDDNPGYMIDKNTILDNPEELDGWQKGDDAFTWMDRLCNDSNYTPHGVYDIRVSNNHVDVVYGLYWWD